MRWWTRTNSTTMLDIVPSLFSQFPTPVFSVWISFSLAARSVSARFLLPPWPQNYSHQDHDVLPCTRSPGELPASVCVCSHSSAWRCWLWCLENSSWSSFLIVFRFLWHIFKSLSVAFLSLPDAQLLEFFGYLLIYLLYLLNLCLCVCVHSLLVEVRLLEVVIPHHHPLHACPLRPGYSVVLALRELIL